MTSLPASGTLAAADMQVAVAAETAASRRGTRERLRRRYELGLAPPLELRLAIATTPPVTSRS